MHINDTNCEVESSVKRIAAILVATAFAGLPGCAVSVPENAFLYPDARIAAEKMAPPFLTLRNPSLSPIPAGICRRPGYSLSRALKRR